MTLPSLLRAVAAAALLPAIATLLHAAEPRVFSGPQPGERATSFNVLDMRGDAATERDPTAVPAARPLALVFVHSIERSLVPLLRAIDDYGAGQQDRLATELVFLQPDRLQGEQRVRAATRSLKLKSGTGFSLDGGEGPGNYGLNRECMMTILAVQGGRVVTNFALVQPGIADAPAVIGALAALCKDPKPPSAEEVLKRHAERMNGRGGDGMAARGDGGGNRDGKDPFPGAVPTDPRLNTLLRQFIRPTNDAATVDRLLGEIETHVGSDPGLRKQAIDGWTRVLHFGDRYGTEYSRKVGREFLERLKKP